MTPDAKAFILRHTRLQRPPHAPELQLHLAAEIEPIWRSTEEALQREGIDPPFWAFAWAGGQALARYLLDHPEEVRGRRVLDFATGSGLVAIAAMKAGASQATGADVDPFCAAAVALNAEANGVEVGFIGEDLLDAPAPEVDVICAGDICYEWPLAGRVQATQTGGCGFCSGLGTTLRAGIWTCWPSNPENGSSTMHRIETSSASSHCARLSAGSILNPPSSPTEEDSPVPNCLSPATATAITR